LTRLDLNLDPPDLHLPSSCDYQHEPPVPGFYCPFLLSLFCWFLSFFFLSFFFNCSTRVWTQSLHFEPLHQPFFVKGFFEIRSHEPFAWNGFKLWSSWSLSPE
jgi:hypothetical protein